MPTSKVEVHRGYGKAHAQMRCLSETKSKVCPKKILLGKCKTWTLDSELWTGLLTGLWTEIWT